MLKVSFFEEEGIREGTFAELPNYLPCGWELKADCATKTRYHVIQLSTVQRALQCAMLDTSHPQVPANDGVISLYY